MGKIERKIHFGDCERKERVQLALSRSPLNIFKMLSLSSLLISHNGQAATPSPLKEVGNQ